WLGRRARARRGAEAGCDAVLRFFAGVLDQRIVKCERCRYGGELRVAVKPFETVQRKKLFWSPSANFASATNAENVWIEACDTSNAAPFRQDSVPKIIDAHADACD